MSVYNFKPEDVGKMPQRIYENLLEQIPAVITYQQTGEVMDIEYKKKKDIDNVKWLREKGELNG